MDTVYHNDREALLGKALLEIAGQCHGDMPAHEVAAMTLDEAFPGRAKGTVLPAKDDYLEKPLRP